MCVCVWRVLSTGSFSQRAVCEGACLRIVVGVSNSRLVCGHTPKTTQNIEVNTSTKEGRKRTHTHTHTNLHTHINIHTNMHKRKHKPTHTHTHTYKRRDRTEEKA